MLAHTGVNIMEDKCVRCKKVKIIYAKSLCKYCYNFVKYGDGRKEYMRRWIEKNPNYYKEYYLNNKDKYNE